MTSRDEADVFDGTWELLHGQEGGQRLPDALARRARLVVTGGTFSLRMGGDILRGTFRSGPSGRPGLVDAVVEEGEARGSLVLGLYRMDGGQLWLCLASPGRRRPRDIDSGDARHVWEALTEVVRLPDRWYPAAGT